MQVEYASERIETLCSSRKAAKKFFGGSDILAISLMARINALQNAETLMDIIKMPPFQFHNLKGNYAGYYAIDVKTRRDPWRIILEPLREDKSTYSPCRIDEVAMYVKIVKIMEVSKHYE